MQQIFYLLFLRPLYNLLALFCFLFNNNLGLAIFVLAIGIRFLIWPWHTRMIASQEKLQKIQPKMKEIQEKYRKDPQTLNKLTFELFKQEKINPLGSFFYVFFQLALFLGFFNIISNLIKEGWANHLYSFVPQVSLNYNFFNLDLKQPSFILAFIYFLIAIITTLIFQKQASQNKLFLFFPFIILLIYKHIPSVLMIFWIGLSFVGLIQEIYLRKYKENKEK